MIVRHSPAGSAVALAVEPDSAWGLQEHLLAGIFDVLSILAWQNTEDGQSGRNTPQPLTRPGVQSPDSTFGSGSMTVEEAEAWLAAKNPLQHQKE